MPSHAWNWIKHHPSHVCMLRHPEGLMQKEGGGGGVLLNPSPLASVDAHTMTAWASATDLLEADSGFVSVTFLGLNTTTILSRFWIFFFFCKSPHFLAISTANSGLCLPRRSMC